MKLNRDEQDAVFRQMAQHPVKSPEWVRLRNGVIPSYYPAAVQMATKWAKRGGSEDDMVAESVAGLLVAAERFDITRGMTFLTFAIPWMLKHCEAAVAAASSQLSGGARRRRGDLSKLAKATTELSNEFGRRATLDESAEAAGLDHFEVAEAVVSGSSSQATRAVAIGVPGRRDAPGEMEAGELTADLIETLWSILTEAEFDVLSIVIGLFGDARGCGEIARERGCKRPEIYALYSEACRKVSIVLLDSGELDHQRAAEALRIIKARRKKRGSRRAAAN